MKTKKIIGTITLSFILGLALAGCSLKTTNSDNNDDGTSQTDGDNSGQNQDSGSEGQQSGDSGSGDSGSTDTTTTYTVIFNTNGGTSVTSQTVAKDGTIQILPTTKRDGYTFDGWYSDASYTTKFTTSTKVSRNITVYAKWTAIQPGDILTSTYGYAEGLYAIFKETNPTSSSIKVEVKKSGDSTYTTVDNELVRKEVSGTSARVDVLGLASGSYDLKVTNSEGVSQTKTDIEVSSYDRSGYAHFKTTNDGTGVNVDNGIGAYNNDGTLKTNAKVVYVSEATKNTVKATIGGKEYIGIVAIMQAQINSSYPLVIRVIGQISAATWTKIDYKNNINIGNTTWTKFNSNKYYNLDIKNSDGDSLAEYMTENELSSITESQLETLGYNTIDDSTYSRLNGLSSKINYSETTKKYDNVSYTFNDFDSSWNNCTIAGAQNMTVEGVGSDAELFQWGMTFKTGTLDNTSVPCKSIEVRNLTFDDTTEDSCSFEGTTNSQTIAGFKDGHIWCHNNTFNQGINYWDVTYEQDKHEGDGSTDIKKLAFVTFAYNRYNNCHKTGLVGGGDTQYTASVTFHHNYYNNCQARLPFARQANMHMYNNYYSSSTGNNMQVYAGAYAFIESSYFENISTTFIIKENTSGTGTPAVKSYNNVYSGCGYYSDATIVTDRTAAVTNENIFNPTFDTDTTDFYYDSTNHVSNVEYLTSAEQAKADCVAYAGAGIMFGINSNNSSNTNNTTYNNDTTNDNNDNTQSTTATAYSLDLSSYSSSATLTSSTTIGNFTVYATSDKSVTVSKSGINLGGTASLSDGYRYIAFYVESGQTVTFTQNNSNSGRIIALAGADGVEYTTSTTTGSDVTASFTVTVSQIYYLYSKGSGITVKAISVA